MHINDSLMYGKIRIIMPLPCSLSARMTTIKPFCAQYLMSKSGLEFNTSYALKLEHVDKACLYKKDS